MSSAHIFNNSCQNRTPQQARDTRARAWAYVYSCWHAKQKDILQETAEDRPSDNEAKEVSHVEHYSDDPSSIDHHPFIEEKE